MVINNCSIISNNIVINNKIVLLPSGRWAKQMIFLCTSAENIVSGTLSSFLRPGYKFFIYDELSKMNKYK